MKKISVSTKFMGRFAGKWVAIDPVKDIIVAVGDTLKEIDPLITRPANDPRSSGTTPAAFKVPYKDEGPYVLWIRPRLFSLTARMPEDYCFQSFPYVSILAKQL